MWPRGREFSAFSIRIPLRSRANLLLTLRQREINGPAADRQHVIAELAELLGADHPDVIEASTNHRLFCVINPQPF